MSITVIDGGFSTQLSRYVGNCIDGDPLWSARFLATHPAAVEQTHLDFLNAGAEVIITNSYQASVSGFKEYLDMDTPKAIDLIKESVRLAKRARDIYIRKNPLSKKPLIAGSVGPYGAALHDGSEYTGCYIHKVPKEEVVEWHRPRIEALLDEGVDLLAIETIPALAEGEALLELLRDYPSAKAWLCFQCKDERKTAHGEIFQDAVRKCWSLNEEQLIGIGCNCLNPYFVTDLLSEINNGLHEDIPLIVYPNSGEQYTPELGWTGKEEKPNLGVFIDEWLNLGVKFVGGCCRTDAEDIKIIKNAVKKWVGS